MRLELCVCVWGGISHAGFREMVRSAQPQALHSESGTIFPPVGNIACSLLRRHSVGRSDLSGGAIDVA